MSMNDSVGFIIQGFPDLLEEVCGKSVPSEGFLYIDVMNHQIAVEYLTAHPSVDDTRVLRIACYEHAASGYEKREDFVTRVEEEILWFIPSATAIVILKPTVKDEIIVSCLAVAE